jgi:undecaprenyl-diphosphatase
MLLGEAGELTVAAHVIDDIPKAVLAAFAGLLAVLALWAPLDHRSRAAAHVRRALSGRARHLVPALVSAAMFAAVAEDVLLVEDQEMILRLDHKVYEAVATIASDPTIHTIASALSRATGEGLVVAVSAAALALLIAKRYRDVLVFVLGTGGAWFFSGLLKVMFGIPRPRAHAPWSLSSYGFPSGHAFVALVACGLLAWLLGRRVTRLRRLPLYAGALLVAALAGSARVVLNAHWLSDVVGGLALGAVWVNLVVLVVESHPRGAFSDSSHPIT